MGEVVAPLDLETHVEPGRSLSLGSLVLLTCDVDHLPWHTWAPRHAQKEPAVVVLCDGDADFSLATPDEVEDILPVVFP